MLPAKRQRLIQFARFPRYAQVKTRLAAAIGHQAAFAAHLELLHNTAGVLASAGCARSELWLDASGSSDDIDRVIAQGLEGPVLQCEGDLGERMLHALADALMRVDRVVLVGSDCPVLSVEYLEQAFHALDTHDLVFGPAEDGGFVLIGAKRVSAGMFAGVVWGEAEVLAQSLESAAACGLGTASLEPLFDVDRLEDWRRWQQIRSGVSDARSV
ncbi:MAG: TIGR04282 family arsenosugar biosynthesis glycosyltransferase [Congregibacter sp.]